MTEMKPKKQLAHLFNATRCIGCTACMNACAQTNYGDVMASGKPIHGRVMPGNIQKIVMDGNRRPFQIMSQCQQCTDAPCIKACPFGANYRDPETGQVKIDPKRCMGCNYCITACPYDARWSNPPREVHGGRLPETRGGGERPGVRRRLPHERPCVRRHPGSGKRDFARDRFQPYREAP